MTDDAVAIWPCERCGAQKSKRSYRHCRSCWFYDRRLAIRRRSAPPTPQDTPCIIWQGSVDRDGYALRSGKKLHRWVIEQINGPLPSEAIVMHKCDNPPCFRFDHLIVGTVAMNNKDRSVKGRNGSRPKPHWLHRAGEQHARAKLSQADVNLIRARLGVGEKGIALAAEFNVSTATISLIRNNRIWTNP